MSRRLAIWIVIVVCFGAAFASAVISAAGSGVSAATTPLSREGVTYLPRKLQSGSGGVVAVIPVTGQIVNGDSAPDGSTVGGDDLVRLIDAVGESGHFDGIILEVNTPGGAVLASAEVAEAVVRAKDEHDLVVVSWMRDVAASGGYYISAPADSIVAAPSTFTGSIGVIMELVNVEGLAGKVGIEPVVIKSGRLKDIGSPYRALTPEERRVLQAIIDEAYGEFVDVVSNGRHLEPAAVRELADGRIYTGRQAKANGLVDRLGTRREAYAEMAQLLDVEGDDSGEKLMVVRFGRSYSFFEVLGARGQTRLELGAAGDLVLAALAGVRGEAGPRTPIAGASTREATPGLPTLEYRAVL